MRREKPAKNNKACWIGRSSTGFIALLTVGGWWRRERTTVIVREGYALSAELVKLNSVLPNGWVFHEAENVAGFAKGTGPIRFDLNRRHSSMANVAWNPNGLVRATRSTSRSSAGPRHHGRPGRVGGRSPTP